MDNKIKPIVEGGLLAAIAVILGLASVYLPVIGIFIEFFWALPIIILTVRQGVKMGTLMLIVSLVLLSLFIGPLLAIRVVLSFGFSGLALGYCVRKNFSAVKIFIASLIVAFTAQIAVVLILLFIMDIDIMGTQVTMIRESFEQSFAMYESMGVDKGTIDQAKAQVEPAISLISILMPTMLMIMAVVNTSACYLTAKWIFPKIGLKMPELPPFAQWRFSIVFLYLAAFALIGLYWGSTRNLSILYEISVNANILAMGVGFIQGLSLMSFAADYYKLSKFIRRLIFIIVIFNFMLIQIVAFTGLFDMWFDYRRRFLNRR